MRKVLNEKQMREYIENEVRKNIMSESIDEGILGNLIRGHMNFPDLMNLAIGIFGVAPIVKWLCGVFGIDVNGPIGKMLVTAISAAGTVAVGDIIQNRRKLKGNQ